MRRSALLLAVLGMLLIGVVPAGADQPIYEVEFDINSHTGGGGEFFISGSATGNELTAAGEYTYTRPSVGQEYRVYDLKCVTVVPSTNTSYDTDYNVMIIGRLEVLSDPAGDLDAYNWAYFAYAPDTEYESSRPIGARPHEEEPSCDPYTYHNDAGYAGMTWRTAGYFDTGSVITVSEVEPLYDAPPKKLKSSEAYKLPADRPLVEDQGWLNIGCGGGDFEWPTESGDYEIPGTLYEMYSGKLDAKWVAKYVGEDTDGRWLYEMTQDFDWKKAVFESGTNYLHYQAEDDWYHEWVGSGDYFDTEATGRMDALVRVVNPHEPIGPGNVEPVDGSIHMAFDIYDETGTRVDWLNIEGTFTDGEFVGTQEGTCVGG